MEITVSILHYLLIICKYTFYIFLLDIERYNYLNKKEIIKQYKKHLI